MTRQRLEESGRMGRAVVFEGREIRMTTNG